MDEEEERRKRHLEEEEEVDIDSCDPAPNAVDVLLSHHSSLGARATSTTQFKRASANTRSSSGTPSSAQNFPNGRSTSLPNRSATSSHSERKKSDPRDGEDLAESDEDLSWADDDPDDDTIVDWFPHIRLDEEEDHDDHMDFD